MGVDRAKRLGLAAAALLALAGGGVALQSTADGEDAPAPEAGAARTDRWLPLADGRFARTEVAAARIGGYVFVVGGFVEDRTTTDVVEIYDIRRDRWLRGRDMPIALNHPAAAAYRGHLLVVGGYRGRSGLSDETAAFFAYNPYSRRWFALPPMPTARAALAVGVIGNRLYAAGGASGALGVLDTLEIFDFARRRWFAGPDMAVAREHVGGAVAHGAFYVLGGRPGDLRVAERYVPSRRAWQRIPDLETGRSGFGAATVTRQRVVAVGGETSAGTIRPVEMYDPRARRWIQLPGMRTPRHGVGVVSALYRVFALQGGPQPGFAFDSGVEYLDVR